MLLKHFAIYILNTLLLFSSIFGHSQLDNEVAWWKISAFFRSIYDRGLQAKAIQDILKEDFDWKVEKVIPEELLKEKLRKSEYIFLQHIKAVQKLVETILDSYDDFTISSNHQHCCYVHSAKDFLGNGCADGTSPGLAGGTPKKVIDQLHNILSIYSLVTNLYVGFEDGSSFSFPLHKTTGMYGDSRCLEYNAKTRPWYVLCQLPKPRDVVIFLDLNKRSFNLVLKTATEVILSLTPEDKVIIVRKDFEIKEGRHVDFNTWLVGTERNKENIIALLNEIILDVEKGYLLPWQAIANKIFANPIKMPLKILRDPELVVVVISSNDSYICGGINVQYPHVENSVILSYYVGDNAKDSISCPKSSRRSHLLRIEKAEDLKISNVSFSSFFKWEDYIEKEDYYPLNEAKAKIPVPYRDYFSKENVLSICFPVIRNNRFKGAACSDVKLANELESMILVPGIDDAYGFIVDGQGRALMHPVLPSIHCTKVYKDSSLHKCNAPTYEVISRLEQNPQVLDVLQAMVDHTNGSKAVDGQLIYSLGHAMEGDLSNAVAIKEMRLLYVWSNFTLTEFSLALVLPIVNGEVSRITYKCKSEEKCKDAKFHYHLDNDDFESPKLCSYFGSEIKIKNLASVKFAPTAFKDVALYRQTKGPHDDPIKLAISKGQDYYPLLKENNLNESVVLAEKTENIWKKDPLECFIGVRYLGTTNGVFMTFPGVTLNATYDHRERAWYQMTIANKRSQAMSLSPPYKDFFSGTRLQSLMFPLKHILPSGTSALVGVVGGDFSVAFLVHRLRGLLPECDGKLLTCYLIDSTGYISAHLNLDSPHLMHIIETDPSIAKHLVTHKVMRRKGCHDYERDSIFLYWEFKMAPNERRYQVSDQKVNFTIYEIPYMNIFLVARQNSNIKSKISFSASIKCSSTCFSTLDLPCRMTSRTAVCKTRLQDMREIFDTLPACWPSNKSQREESKHDCKTGVPSCYQGNEQRECDLWKPQCYK